jgi:hypothetical protein
MGFFNASRCLFFFCKKKRTSQTRLYWYSVFYKKNMFIRKKMSTCEAPGCKWGKYPGSSYCFEHTQTPEVQAKRNAHKAQRNAANALQARYNASEKSYLDDGAGWAAEHVRPLHGADQKFLLLGAQPDNKREGREYLFEQENIFLLGDTEIPANTAGLNWSRYIRANFNRTRDLQKLAYNCDSMFDEIAFDGSTGFDRNPEHLQYFNKILKLGGIFFITSYNHLSTPSEQPFIHSLNANGFEAKRVRMGDLMDIGITLVPGLLRHTGVNGTVIVAVKRRNISNSNNNRLSGRRNNTRNARRNNTRNARRNNTRNTPRNNT